MLLNVTSRLSLRRLHKTTQQIGTKKQGKLLQTRETDFCYTGSGSVVRVVMDDCVICKETTNVEDQAMECDLSEG